MADNSEHNISGQMLYANDTSFDKAATHISTKPQIKSSASQRSGSRPHSRRSMSKNV